LSFFVLLLIYTYSYIFDIRLQSISMACVRSQAQTTPEVILSNPWHDRGFCDPDQYQAALGRCQNGYESCDLFIKAFEQRANIEREYIMAIQNWSKMWQNEINESQEFGTNKKTWLAAIRAGEQAAYTHTDIVERIQHDVIDQMVAFKKQNYAKSIIHIRKIKEFEKDFENLQKPWLKLLSRINDAKESYHEKRRKLKRAEQAKKIIDSNTGASEEEKTEAQISVNAYARESATLRNYGNVGVFPIQVDNDDNLQHMIAKRHGYRSTFKNESERIEPGFYQVYLDTHKVKVELTATEQIGVHRYPFDNVHEKHCMILIDSSYALPLDGCRQSHVNVDPNKNEITGSIFFKGFLSRAFGGVTTYFVITFTNWIDFGVWTQGRLMNRQTTADGCSSGVYVMVLANQQQRLFSEYMDHIYTDLFIWDIFRTQVPFLILHDSKRANDIVHSIMLIVEQGGYLPKWPLANRYTNCMIGSHADIILSNLIMKHKHDLYFNMTQILEALRIVANKVQKHDSRFDPPTYIKYQYVPFDMDEYSASLTLNYAYDDWTIGNIMYAAGLIDEAQEYYNRSQWFENIFENTKKIFCPRNSTGNILCPSSEIEYLIPFDYRYTEGDA
ncbi:unnamed protein product, partial [Rotaria sordida]